MNSLMDKLSKPKDFEKDGVWYTAIPGRNPTNCAGCDLLNKARNGQLDCVGYRCGPYIFKEAKDVAEK